ncbi:MAG: uroporphyrinogen decarboxylase family protein [Promethearchaeota archaeon]
MNPKELTLSAIEGNAEKVPFNPIIMHLAAVLFNVDYSGIFCRKPEILARCQVKCANFFGIDSLLSSTDAYREASAWGVEVDFTVHTPIPKNNSHLDWRKFDSVETPDLNSSPRVMERIEAIKLMKEMAPEQCIFGWIEAPFAEMCAIFDLMGVVHLINHPDGLKIIDGLLSRIVPVQLEFAKMQIEAGADIIGAGDSAISQFGPKWYKQTSLKKTRELFEEIKKHVPVCYHVCGDNSGVDKEGNDMLLLIASTGASIIDLDFQVDLALAKKKIGKQACIRGNTSTTLLGDRTEDPARIIEEISENIIIGKEGGKYMYSAGCEWPWEPVNMAARNLGIAKALTEKLGRLE